MSFMKWEVRPLAEGVLGGGKGQGSEGGGEKGESETVTAECRGATGPQSRPGARGPWAMAVEQVQQSPGPADSPALLLHPHHHPLPSCSGPDPERAPSCAPEILPPRSAGH